MQVRFSPHVTLPLLAALLPFAAPSPGWAGSTNATDRCRVRDCLCPVVPEPRPAEHSRVAPRNVVLPDRVIIYFDEDQSNLDSKDIADLNQFLSRNPNSSYQVTGHADVCGNPDYNLRLGTERAETVAEYLQGRNPNSSIRTSSLGEQSASAHHEYYRKVEVLTSRAAASGRRPPGWMSARLQECRAAGADFYLLDGSGSMAPYWADVLSFSFPSSSRVRLSIMSGCSSGQSLATVSPQSGTEIWYSYWRILDDMRPGQTLCIASDFQSNVALSSREAAVIEQKVREKQVRVVVIHY